MKIIFGCDHAAQEMKRELKEYVESLGHKTEDIGAFDNVTPYPAVGRLAGEKLAAGEADRIILMCGTGFGISLAANKVRGVRCVNCSEPYTAELSRMHNNANGLAVGARVVGMELAKMIVKIFLQTEFESGGRHEARTNMIE